MPDQAAFQRCNSSTAAVPAIEADIAEVRRIGGSGTPTLVINGLLVRPPYSPAALAGHVETALAKARK